MQIGSAFCFGSTVGKLHNALHHATPRQDPADGPATIAPHLRSDRLLLERGRPITRRRQRPRPHRQQRRHRPCHPTPTPPHTRYPGHQPTHEGHRRPTRPQDLSHDHGLRPHRRQDPSPTSTSPSPTKSRPSTTNPTNSPPATKAPKCANSAPRCTSACSATATAPDPSRSTATSNRSSCNFFVTTIEFKPTLRRQRSRCRQRPDPRQENFRQPPQRTRRGRMTSQLDPIHPHTYNNHRPHRSTQTRNPSRRLQRRLPKAEPGRTQTTPTSTSESATTASTKQAPSHIRHNSRLHHIGIGQSPQTHPRNPAHRRPRHQSHRNPNRRTPPTPHP